jgi:hypothetical protein
VSFEFRFCACVLSWVEILVNFSDLVTTGEWCPTS